jgi:hypothetical protein
MLLPQKELPVKTISLQNQWGGLGSLRNARNHSRFPDFGIYDESLKLVRDVIALVPVVLAWLALKKILARAPTWTNAPQRATGNDSPHHGEKV